MNTSEVVIIGAGPSGLMAAEALAMAGHRVTVYDAMPKPGRKFLVAGRGGLNITREEPLTEFAHHYGKDARLFFRILSTFSPTDLKNWLKNKGVETFVGSSAKVFPKDVSALSLLNHWLQELKQTGVTMHTGHRLIGFMPGQNLCLINQEQKEISVRYDAALLALGGASWPQTGSDGTWAAMLSAAGIQIERFKPANCGFEVNWSPYFREHFNGKFFKNILITSENGNQAQGDIVITQYGIEGSPVYHLSAELRDQIAMHSRTKLYLDLKRDLEPHSIRERLSKQRGKNTLANHLRKALGISEPILPLIKECAPEVNLTDPDFDALAKLIKQLPLVLQSPRPLAEAISTAGGINLNEINDKLMLKKMPGVFVAGEMLDWEAPTGGYLLQAAFSTGVVAAQGIMHWLTRSEVQSKSFP